MMSRLLVIKLFLTGIITLALLLPFIYPGYPFGQPAVLAEIAITGPKVAWLVIAGFLVAVYFYCSDLETVLQRVNPQHQTRSPRSVWLMFLIPYNFIEDFFIIHHLSQSIKAEAVVNHRLSGLRGDGRYCGMLWCGAQLLALAPGLLGHLASLVALIGWMMHWSFVRRVNDMLAIDQ